MYNRYVRNDQGTYSRIPVDDTPPQQPTPHVPAPQAKQEHTAHTFQPEHTPPPPPFTASASPHRQETDEREKFGLSGFLRRLLDRFHLEKVDSGDLLLLLILFLLFKEDADDELLIALGLLLILQ